ncbi:hypothetical protein B0H14DRAFT_3683276 [Mycena olivaceomarginata]|nr:hypothetical protein B0H14DRAFT_3683276 [Mycena olivaceomarginata]
MAFLKEYMPLPSTTQPATTSIFGQPSTSQFRRQRHGAPKPAPAFRSSFGLGGQQQQQQPNNAASTLSTSALRPPGATQPGQEQGSRGPRPRTRRPVPTADGADWEIAAAWNAAGPGCQSQYIFYHRVDPAQVGLYGRPPNTTNDALWARVVRENPDPEWEARAQGVSSADWYDVMRAEGVAMRFECECVSAASRANMAAPSPARSHAARSFISFLLSLPFPCLRCPSFIPPSSFLPFLTPFLPSSPPSSPFSALLPTPYELTALHSLVPVIAVGFDDLRQRVDAQGHRRERTRRG